MKPSGYILFQDEYDQIYESEWSTTDGVIDMTNIVKQPFIWGVAPSGYIKNGVLYRKGMITVTRQLLKPTNNGYDIIADGSSQHVDYIQMNYPCARKPVDNFKHHLNYNLDDEVSNLVTQGSHWTDPNSITDDSIIWSDIDESGESSPTNSLDSLEFIDVWN